MNYLTNYYKNLSEQLQAKVNHLQGQLDEVFVLDPNQKFAAPIVPTTAETGPNNSRASRMEQGRKRADVLGQMVAAQSYEGANDHEKAAIAKIIADTQSSTPERSEYGYGNFLAYPPSAKQTGTEASGKHLRTALGAVKRLSQDPKFAQHVTNTISEKLPETMVNRAHMEDMYSDQDYPTFGSREAKRLTAISAKNAKDLSASSTPSSVTAEFGERMFNTFPGEKEQVGDKEYSHFVPMDMVTKMLGKKNANSQAQKQMNYSEEPDYDSDPPTAEDAQAFRRMTGQTNRTPRSRGEGGGISPYHQ